MKRLLHFPVRTVQAAVLIALLATAAFVLLTRTEVGRDALRVQTEHAFGQALEGELRIGALSGNLVGTVYATGVELLDPVGRTVLQADSVVVRPTWRALLTRRVEVKEATLIRPRVMLVYDNGRWNLPDVFRPRQVSTTPADPLGLRLADVTIIDGTVVTSRIGPAPGPVANGAVFDYTTAELRSLDAAVRLELADGEQNLTVSGVRATLIEPNIRVDRFDGELDLADGLRLSNLSLETAGSRLSGTLFLARSTGTAERAVEVDLDAAQLDLDEWSRLLPVLPVRNRVALDLRARGTLSAIGIERLAVAHGDSRVDVSGTVSGLPERAVLDLDVAPSVADPQDLAAVWPSAPLPWGTADLGPLSLSGTVSARVPVELREPFRLETRFAARGREGAARGSLWLRRPVGGKMGVRLDAVATRLNPGAVLGLDALDGVATGRVEVATPAAPLASDSTRVDSPGEGVALRLDLQDVRLPARTADALQADVVFAGGAVAGTAALRQGRSRIAADGRFGFRQGYSATGRARLAAFDLSQLVPAAPRTELSGTVEVDAGGPSFSAWTGEAGLSLTSAAVALADSAALQPISLERAELDVTPVGESPRLRFSSDLADVRLETPLPLDVMVPVLVGWSRDLVGAGIRAWRHEPLPSPSTSTSGPSSVPSRPFELDVRLRRPDALGSVAEALAGLGPTTLRLRGDVGSEALDVALEATATTLQSGVIRADSLKAELLLTSDRRLDLASATQVSLGLAASDVHLWPGRNAPPRFEAPALRLDYADRHADLVLTSARAPARMAASDSIEAAPEPIELLVEAELDLLDDRKRARLDTLWADAGELILALVEPTAATIRDDRIGLERVAFVRQGVPGPPQRLAFSGVLSPSSTDSLVVEAERLELNEVLAALNVRTPLGGLLDGRAAVAGALGRPAVGGRVVLDPLLFDGRPAGRAVLVSQILGGDAGLGVDLQVSPLSAAELATPGAAENDLSITGEMRLPSRREDGSRDPGRLALDVDAERLDLFFFDWLFPSILSDAHGAAAGSGRIQGTFAYPIFLAGLDVEDGGFEVPAFGLSLGAEGRVEVDGDGIHVRKARVTDGDGGSGVLAGSVLFNRYRYFSLDLAGRLSDMQVIDVPASDDLPFYGDIRASGDLSLTGPLDNTFLRSENAVTTPESRIYIPVTASGPAQDEAFLIFADSLGRLPEREQRRNLVSRRPQGERAFLDGLDMLLNISAPPGSTVHLVFDPVTGEEIVAQGDARIQLGIADGRFATYGRFEVGQGEYAFTAGDVFTRTFELEPGGTLVWTGDPIDARMNLAATYRTRAALAGLGLPEAQERQRVPVVVRADVGGRVTAPLVQLSLSVDRQGEGTASAAAAEALRTRLNETDRRAEFATSVLLTNTFLLAPSDDFGSVGEVADELLYTSLGALVSSRVGGFVNRALGSDQVEVLLGVQPGTDAEALDVTYGVALRFLDERLVLRGEGLYQRDASGESADPLQGEVAAELRLSDEVSIEVFARREGDPLVGEGVAADPYGTVGAGVTYRSEFTSWRRFFQRLFGGREERGEAEASTDPALPFPASAD